SSRLMIAEKTIQYTRYEIHGRHIVDTFLLAQYYDVGTRELESFGLKHVAKHFGVSESDRVMIPGDKIQDAYLNDRENFILYALQDVRETRALAGVLSASYFIQAQIFPYNYQDVIVRGNATRIDSLFLREYLHRKHSIPDYPESRAFEGGYTDIFFTGVKRDVWHCDVTSLYPSVMLQFGYLPATDELEIFRAMLTELRTFRLTAKGQMREAKQEAERRHFEALQNTFKILINSFYGYLGFSQGHFADYDAASAVTAKGRELLKAMVEWLQKQGAEVIEIDTDGIYFHPPQGATMAGLENGMKEILPNGIDVEFDRQYRSMFSYKAKNYALLDSEGVVTIKGAALKSRGLERFQREFLENMIRNLLEEKPEQVQGMRDEFERKIRGRELPIEMLMKRETLQDSVASYQKKIGASSRNKSAAFELAIQSGRDYQAGDQVSYYVTGTKKKVTAYENAKLIEHWNPESRDENVEYYAAKLDELMKKFAEFLNIQDPNQPTLLL
ncbi:MAG: DNA polymerase domain-containing protein, partial [Chthoniobacterales bacterium]